MCIRDRQGAEQRAGQPEAPPPVRDKHQRQTDLSEPGPPPHIRVEDRRGRTFSRGGRSQEGGRTSPGSWRQ
eukprot:8010592-Pyramimonas_sp.AAC.1